MSPLHLAALQYAELGYAVFPCRPGDSRPLTEHGFHDATCDEATIDAWWSQRPNANIGLSAGGLLIVDVDVTEQGEANPWLADHPDRYFDLIAAPTSTTPRGGRHHVFRRPPDKHWRISAGELAPRVDIRTDGGYVVVPPSARPDGRYVWIDGLELDAPKTALPEPPPWLIELLDASSDSGRSAPGERNGHTASNQIPQGVRSKTLARLAGSMRRVGMSQSEITAALRQVGRERCQPVMTERDVDPIAASIARYAPDEVSVAFVENLWDQMQARQTSVQFHGITSAELDANTYELEYLIPGLLVRGQPGIIAGPKKTLKTNISIDLAISLGQCERFLNAFPVATRTRVGLMSGESGAATIQETARRVAASKGLLLRDCDNVIWEDRVPQLGEESHIKALRNFISERELEVLILDPTYLMMLGIGDNAGNLFIVGSFLKALGDLAQETGCTPILCHHLKKSIVAQYEPAELENIAWAGFQEFVRQWLLLNRRIAYAPAHGGHHELWLSAGGSAGHSGLWGINIDEGTRQDDNGRHWEVQILTGDEAYAERERNQLDARENQTELRNNLKLQRHVDTLLNALQEHPDGETRKALRVAAGLNPANFNAAVSQLLEEGEIENCDIKKHGRTYAGLRLFRATEQREHTGTI